MYVTETRAQTRALAINKLDLKTKNQGKQLVAACCMTAEKKYEVI